MFIVTPIVGVCNCSMFCCSLLYVHYSIAVILVGKRELVALLNLSSWCLVMVMWLFLTVPRGCLRFVILLKIDHTYLLFLKPRVEVMKGLDQVDIRTKVGQASDSMTALTLSFNLRIGALCLSVAGPTMAQLEVFFSSDYL